MCWCDAQAEIAPNYRLMLLVLALITFIGTQMMLSAMFPYAELGSVFTIPASILSTAVLMYLYYWLIDNIPPLEKASFVLGVLTLGGIVAINVELHKQEGSPGVWDQMGNYIHVVQNYNSITCDTVNEPINSRRANLKPGEVERYVAALHRCREIIPIDGTYALYAVQTRNISNPDLIIHDIDEIPQKLETSVERYFYNFLEWRFN